MDFDIYKLIDAGGTVVLAVLLLKAVTNDLKHVNIKLTEIAEILRERLK